MTSTLLLLVFKIVESLHYILIKRKRIERDRAAGGYWLKKIISSVINRYTIHYATFIFGSQNL